MTIYGPSLDIIFADSICDVIKEHKYVVEFCVGTGSVKFEQKFVDLVSENKVIQYSGSGNTVDAAYF